MKSLTRLQRAKSIKGISTLQGASPSTPSQGGRSDKKARSLRRRSRNLTEEEHHREIATLFGSEAKTKEEVLDDISQAVPALEKRMGEHKASKEEAQGRLKEVCAALREAVDTLEEHFAGALEQSFFEEELRLQDTLNSMKSLASDGGKGMSDEGMASEFARLRANLSGVQRYAVVAPDDIKKWALDALASEVRVSMDHALSEEALLGQAPRITDVSRVGPSEIHIRFVAPDDRLKDAEYRVEMWNGKAEDAEVRSMQVVGLTHNAYVDWRFEDESECRVRGRAIRTGTYGEECLTGWSDWAPFTVPKKHRGNGVFGAGLVWSRREPDEMYTVADVASGEVLYSGMKPYTTVPRYTVGHKVLITAVKGSAKWEETRTVEKVSMTPENILDDMRLFHSDRDICRRALEEIALIAKCKNNNSINFKQAKKYFIYENKSYTFQG